MSTSPSTESRRKATRGSHRALPGQRPGPLLLLAGVLLLAGPAEAAAAPEFRAGSASVDISPPRFPVIVNGMFTGRTASRVVDPLFARALVLEDGATEIAIVAVDSCMLPRELLDHVKELATRSTGIPSERILISSTHTHSAPSAMGCLGSAVDIDYARWLPPRIAGAIEAAHAAREPAQIGWGAIDAWGHTFNRRWIRRPDRLLEDPFGRPSARAHMHPGHESPDVVGPSGPVDPQLSVVGVRSAEGRPLALLANFSMHYYESEMVSSDYFGRFSRHVAELLGAPDRFHAIISQGTSGDLMWMDYSAPRNAIGYDAYARELATLAHQTWKGLTWHNTAPLAMAEERITLDFRVPDAERLAWARKVAEALGDRPPSTLPEIYALEALQLHARPRAELKVQAIGIGGLGIVGLPNEVFAITGLRIKAASPFQRTFVVSLANGAEGYIPPPEQHSLGGYTTWPARTAGLVPAAEPTLVETALGLLAKLPHPSRAREAAAAAPYPRTVLASHPTAYWRLEESLGSILASETGKHPLQLEPQVALYLPGADGRRGFQPPEPPAPNAFSGAAINRALHFAGGRARAADLPRSDAYTFEAWIWNGLPADARAVTGYFFSRGEDGAPGAPGDHLGLGGTAAAQGKLIVFNGNARNQLLEGKTPLEWRRWHHVVLVRDGARVRVHLNGAPEPEMEGDLESTSPSSAIFLGGRSDGFAGWEGKLDEAAFYNRALTTEEIRAHFLAGGLLAGAPTGAGPRSPEVALAAFDLEPGLEVAVVAAEPLIASPCAFDWDEAGALYVAENRGYPSSSDPPLGRIARLVDRTSDGTFDERTDFAVDLTFPNGVLWWQGGLIVTCAPEVLFLRDLDGDGRADERRILLSGFATNQSTQLRVNDPTLLPDGSIAFAGGLSGGVVHDVRFPTATVDTASRDLRWHPASGRLELLDGKSQWGHEFDEVGDRFICMNRIQAQHVVLPSRYLGRNSKLARSGSVQDCPEELLRPISGGESPAARIYPLSDQLVIKDAHQGTFSAAGAILLWRGGRLPERYEGRLLSCDPSANLVHSDTLVPSGATFRARRDPGATELLRSSDNWFRPVFLRQGKDGSLYIADMYRKVIDHPDYMPGKVREHADTGAGRDHGRIWKIRGTARELRAASRRLEPDLRSAAPAERILALRAAESHLAGDQGLAARALELASDPEARVRFQCALSLGELGDDPRLPAALARIALAQPEDAWTRTAVLSSGARCAPELLRLVLAASRPTSASLVEETAELVRAGEPGSLDSWLALAAKPGLPFPLRAALCLGLGSAPESADLRAAARDAIARRSGDELLAIRLAGLWADAEMQDLLLEIVSAGEASEIQAAAARGLNDVSALLQKERWAACAPPTQQAIVQTALRSPPGVEKLLRAMETDAVPPQALAAGAREQLQRSSVVAVRERARRLFALRGGEDRLKVYEDWKDVLALPADPGHGREVFARLCASCHRLDRQGFAVGPDLFDIRNQPRETALYHILVPDGEIYQGFQSYTVTTTDGRVLVGLLGSETRASVTLRLPAGVEERLLRSEITSLSASEHSLMPSGLEQTMTRSDLADLLAHLRGE